MEFHKSTASQQAARYELKTTQVVSFRPPHPARGGQAGAGQAWSRLSASGGESRWEY
ncbi:MAG: hypothetical protein HY978_00065 [Candidatus Liptonbacteria bacterium]|nr:hypothetical protein [Candidatus Liptonbacteria bacterium]